MQYALGKKRKEKVGRGDHDDNVSLLARYYSLMQCDTSVIETTCAESELPFNERENQKGIYSIFLILEGWNNNTFTKTIEPLTSNLIANFCSSMHFMIIAELTVRCNFKLQVDADGMCMEGY